MAQVLKEIQRDKILEAAKQEPVSYTHLDVYKRQVFFMLSV